MLKNRRIWLTTYNARCINTNELQLAGESDDGLWIMVGSVALQVARRTNDRKVAGSRPTNVVCITVLTGNRMGVNCPLWPAATPSSEL